MTFTEAIRAGWFSLSLTKRLTVAGVVLLIVILTVASWVSSFNSWRQIREYEAEANAAKVKANAAIEQAAKIASEIKIREAELSKIEEKRDEAKGKADAAKGDVDDARRKYDAAVRSRRESAPSTDELCRELAELGHACD